MQRKGAVTGAIISAGDNSIAGQSRVCILVVAGGGEQSKRGVVAQAVIHRQTRSDAPGVLDVNSQSLNVLREAAVARGSGLAIDIGGDGRSASGTEIKLRGIGRVKAGIIRVGENRFGRGSECAA